MDDLTHKTLCELLDDEEIESKVRNNKVTFEYKDKVYRLKRVNLRDQIKIKRQLSRVTTELLQDESIKTEGEIIKLWKNKSIDIVKMTEDFQDLYQRYKNSLYKLGEAIKRNAPPKEVEILEKKTVELKNSAEEIQSEKTSLLSSSYEAMLLEETYHLYLFYSLEVEEDGELKQVFSSYENMKETIEPGLMELSITYMVFVRQYGNL